MEHARDVLLAAQVGVRETRLVTRERHGGVDREVGGVRDGDAVQGHDGAGDVREGAPQDCGETRGG